MLRTIGVVAAVLAALSVGACQKALTKPQYVEMVAYLKEHPEGLDRMVEHCAAEPLTNDDRRALRVVGIVFGFKAENTTAKSICTNIFKGAASGRLSYEDYALISSELGR